MRYRILVTMMVGLVGALAVPVAAMAHGAHGGIGAEGSAGIGGFSGSGSPSQYFDSSTNSVSFPGVGKVFGNSCGSMIFCNGGMQIGGGIANFAGGGFGLGSNGIGVDAGVEGVGVKAGIPGDVEVSSKGGGSIALPDTGLCPIDASVDIRDDLNTAASALTALTPADIQTLIKANGGPIMVDTQGKGGPSVDEGLSSREESSDEHSRDNRDKEQSRVRRLGIDQEMGQLPDFAKQLLGSAI